jgi:hypothetical protein
VVLIIIVKLLKIPLLNVKKSKNHLEKSENLLSFGLKRQD